nr:MAG TPA: replisome organizer protein [Caudoviricetes sp.]DAU96824.1 MAG TPA: replisome organizer protein [Caudoviricetes sp.]
MAQRRMFSRKITDTDKFIEMPATTQNLYFHLNMNADDEGFVDRVSIIQRMIGASGDDLKLLIAKGFIIPFESGVVVIRHWRIHNYIQADRFQATIYQNEKSQIEYDDTKTANIKPLEQCIQDVYKLDTQVRLGKDSLDKERLELDKVNNQNNTVPVENKKSLSKIFKDSEIKLNERHLQMIYEYIALDHFTVPMIQYAVERTEDAGSTSFNYLNKILKNWKEKGYKSLEEVENDDRAFEEKKKEQANNRTKDFKTGKYALLGTDISVHEIDPELGF